MRTLVQSAVGGHESLHVIVEPPRQLGGKGQVGARGKLPKANAARAELLVLFVLPGKVHRRITQVAMNEEVALPVLSKKARELDKSLEVPGEVGLFAGAACEAFESFSCRVGNLDFFAQRFESLDARGEPVEIEVCRRAVAA